MPAIIAGQVEKFGAAVNKSLDYLEATLPPGSTVILIGLVGQDRLQTRLSRWVVVTPM